MRSRATRRPLPCWLSIALGPPPSRIFSSSLWTCDMRSARKRILASKRAEVASTRVSRVFATCRVADSVRSAIGEELETVYGIPAERRRANRSRTPWSKLVGCYDGSANETNVRDTAALANRAAAHDRDAGRVLGRRGSVFAVPAS